ncbi:hypothetical protein HYV57_03525 [Candidatus Peregrinibacteria bacterium]|nr:hypothetical protein [Candidatus Peregrinibacteria bacterium]
MEQPFYQDVSAIHPDGIDPTSGSDSAHNHDRKIFETHDRGAFGIFSFLLIFVFFAVLGFAGYYTFIRFHLDRQIGTLEIVFQENQKKIQILQQENLNRLALAEKAGTYLKENAVIWSEALQTLLIITPKDVEYSSYSVDEKGHITLNAVTSSLSSASRVIRVLEDSSDFEMVFSPSISQGITSEGQKVVIFPLQLEYQQRQKVARKD